MRLHTPGLRPLRWMHWYAAMHTPGLHPSPLEVPAKRAGLLHALRETNAANMGEQF